MICSPPGLVVTFEKLTSKRVSRCRSACYIFAHQFKQHLTFFSSTIFKATLTPSEDRLARLWNVASIKNWLTWLSPVFGVQGTLHRVPLALGLLALHEPLTAVRAPQTTRPFPASFLRRTRGKVLPGLGRLVQQQGQAFPVGHEVGGRVVAAAEVDEQLGVGREGRGADAAAWDRLVWSMLGKLRGNKTNEIVSG